jgi:putative glycosyl hydrolase
MGRRMTGRRTVEVGLLCVGVALLGGPSEAGKPTAQITRPELKALSAAAYFPGSGIQLTEAIANDLATLKVDMVRVELIGQNDADKTICYSAYDRIVDRLAARQIKVLGLLDYQSIAWASSSDWTTDDFRLRFVARVQEIVGHYSSRANPIRHWEIWNEEDICVQGYCPRIDPEFYGHILIDAYHAIKAIDPGATVVLGGISPKGFEYSSNYLSDLYGTAALQTHLGQYGYHPFDAVGVHPYAEVFTSPNPGLADVLDNKVKAVMNANGDAAKKVWLTEMGWNSSQVSESSQASYLTQSYQMMDTHTDPAYPGNGPYVERYFWFAYADFGTVDLWGLKTADLSRAKPSYTAYKNLGPSSVTKPIPPPEDSMPGLTRESSADPLTLSIQPDSADPLNGLVATRLSGGFHPANTNPADQEPAFTDGAGLGALTGLLADYPGQNTPAWSGFWALAGGGTVDLREVRVFSGNAGKDGRVFHHYDLYVTSDPAPSASSAWAPLRQEVTSAAFGTSNASHSIQAMLTRLSDPSGGSLATGITALRLDFYSVSGNDNLFHDDWDACNGDDRDGAGAAFQSPLIYEVDAYFGSGQTATSLHVDSIVLGTVSVGKSKKGRAVVTVKDNLGNPVPAATVSGTFSGSYSETVSAVTDASGVATLTTSGQVRGAVSFQFCVDSVTHASLAYQPGDNRETCHSY